jgi:hypothetical protein
MHLASSSRAYRAFATTFEACEASFFRWEHVLQIPGLRQLDGQAAPDEQEFVVEENVNFNKQKSAEVVRHKDKQVKTLNITLPSKGAVEEEPDNSTHLGALTFNPSPPLEEDKEFQLAAADNQAKLMRWHYRLGHLLFAKLKMLAKSGEIPHCLAKAPAPKCMGCLFGAMTKLPWHGKESKSSHEVIITTKSGECVSVDHMISTHMGFFAQLKGKTPLSGRATKR